MSDGLVKGERRVGDLVDFDEETPEVKVTLERSDRDIGVTVPWSSLDSPYARWFLKEPHGMRDPQGTDLLSVPKRLLFQDSHGSILLIGCRAGGYHSDLLVGHGSGTLWARAAVLEPEGGYEFDRLDGLRTEISGLRAWLGVTSLVEAREVSKGVRSVTLTVKSPPDIEVGEHGGLEFAFHPSCQILSEDGGDRRVVDDLMRCETRSREPVEWSEHL